MPSAQELYELWADDAELLQALHRSLEPRGTEWLFEAFAALGPARGDVVLDVGARNGKHARELAERFGVEALAIDPVPQRPDVREARAEALPFDDASVDWIWCRDVLVHVDAQRALAECARVLKPGGAMLAYVTVATDLLEPREEARLAEMLALTPSGFRREPLEAAARDAGFAQRSVEELGTEWRERMLEDGTWNATEDLLALARLQRTRPQLVDRYGAAAVDAAEGGLSWGLYQLLGKTRPTVFVWERR
jgi:SAM-dependent methyltransferase